MDPKRRVFCVENTARGLPFHIEVKNSNAHVTDQRMATKMRHLFDPLHAEGEGLGRENIWVQGINRDAQAVFIKQAVIELNLRMTGNGVAL